MVRAVAGWGLDGAHVAAPGPRLRSSWPGRWPRGLADRSARDLMATTALADERACSCLHTSCAPLLSPAGPRFRTRFRPTLQDHLLHFVAMPRPDYHQVVRVHQTAVQLRSVLLPPLLLRSFDVVCQHTHVMMAFMLDPSTRLPRPSPPARLLFCLIASLPLSPRTRAPSPLLLRAFFPLRAHQLRIRCVHFPIQYLCWVVRCGRGER
jgi:hypothetical protein